MRLIIRLAARSPGRISECYGLTYVETPTRLDQHVGLDPTREAPNGVLSRPRGSARGFPLAGLLERLQVGDKRLQSIWWDDAAPVGHADDGRSADDAAAADHGDDLGIGVELFAERQA